MTASGPRQRGSAAPMTASADSRCDQSSAQRIIDTTPSASKYTARRRKSSKSFIRLSSMEKSKWKRLLLRLEKSPQLLSIFVASTVTVVILLGITVVALFRSLSSEVTSSHDYIRLTSKMRKASDAPFHNVLRDVTWTGEYNDSVLKAKREVGRDQGKSVNIESMPAMEILIFSTNSRNSSFKFPSNRLLNKMIRRVPDYGGLDLVIFAEEEGRRYITVDFARDETNFRDANAPLDDDMDSYYWFDDDYHRGLVNAFDESGTINKNKRCRRIAEHGMNLQNCNEFHQLDHADPSSQIRYINEGAYRQVFSVVHPYRNQTELIAMKDISFEHDSTHEEFEFVRMDAIVAERLSASPRIYDIYGFCGIGILSEYFHHGDLEDDVTGGNSGYITPDDLDDEKEVKPQNELTGIEKLVLALEMAESLADLHGYVHGVISHDDLNLSQYLFNKDKTRLKLNDFNRAEFRLFDEEKNEYCQWNNGHGHGSWRSPEEYLDQPLTEQIDVWSLGNNMYTLLTGLYPFYDLEFDEDDYVERLLKGERAYIDPRYKERSPSEAVLAELIPKCFDLKPDDRVTIFEIVDILREAVEKNLNIDMTREKVLKGVKTRR